jgi:hypothetical protein
MNDIYCVCNVYFQNHIQCKRLAGSTIICGFGSEEGCSDVHRPIHDQANY